MNKIVIIVNFKAYPEALGEKGVELARKLSYVHNKNKEIIIVPTFLMLREIIKEKKITVYAPHLDPYLPGAHTGSITIEEAKSLGITGTLLNHSERKIPFSILKESVKRCHQKNIITVVCASTLLEVKKVAQLKPSFIAYEPPELIGGDVSVSKAKPDLIYQAVKVIGKISSSTKMLCGAGVHSSEDIHQALKLGTKGVLIGHAVPKAKYPQKALERMLE